MSTGAKHRARRILYIIATPPHSPVRQVLLFRLWLRKPRLREVKAPTWHHTVKGRVRVGPQCWEPPKAESESSASPTFLVGGRTLEGQFGMWVHVAESVGEVLCRERLAIRNLSDGWAEESLGPLCGTTSLPGRRTLPGAMKHRLASHLESCISREHCVLCA